MRDVLFPLNYLRLEKESARKLVWRDVFYVGAMTVFTLAIFTAIQANFFGKDGLLERLGSLAATLTGFFIAALVAVATFAAKSASLDEPITVGKIVYRASLDEKHDLTRREYVCSMFGYAAFLSLVISVLAIFITSVAQPIKSLAWNPTALLILSKSWMIVILMMVFHLVITTFRGLYYLVDRLYAKEIIILPRSDIAEKDK